MSAGPERDERMMDVALRVAHRGRPSPNPHVGAVVSVRNRVIAVAHHERAGLAHAEAAALAKAGKRARGATLYVTFEPCNHHGRTPPCTDAILRAGIKRVVVGSRDPAPHQKGGTARLRRAGIEVTFGVRRKETDALVADFTKHITTGLPFVVLKAAVTLDGKMAAASGESRWITGEAARRHAHRLRAEADAVLVGVGTVLADNPRLTVRHGVKAKPLRVIIDTYLKTPVSSALVRDRQAPTLVFHGSAAPKNRARPLARSGVELVSVPVHRGRLSLRHVLGELGRRGVVRLLVEGGPTVHAAFLEGDFVDAVAIFVAPALMGSATRMAELRRIDEPSITHLDDDILFEGRLEGRLR